MFIKDTSWSVSFCNKEEFQVEMSRKIVLWKIFVDHRSAWFPLLSACRLVEFDTSVICHVFVLLRLISIARYAFKSPRICSRGTKHEICREHVTLIFALYIVSRARLRLSTVGRFLSTDVIFCSRMILLGRCCSFTLRKLHVCLETF